MDCPADKPVAFGGGGYYLKLDNHYSTAGEVHSNTVTANGSSWLYRSRSLSPTDKLVVTTQCASLPGSHVETTPRHDPLRYPWIWVETCHVPSQERRRSRAASRASQRCVLLVAGQHQDWDVVAEDVGESHC